MGRDPMDFAVLVLVLFVTVCIILGSCNWLGSC